MAHKRKDTLTAPPEWCKHMKPENKRRIAKSERRAARDQINAELINQSELQEEAEKLSDVQAPQNERGGYSEAQRQESGR